MKIWSIFVAFLENMNCTNEYVMKNAVFKKIRIFDPFYCALFYSFHTFFCAAFNCLVKKVLTTSQVKRLSWLSVPLRLFSTQNPRCEGANRKKSWKTFLSNRRCSPRTKIIVHKSRGGVSPQIREQMCLETHFQSEFFILGLQRKKIRLPWNHTQWCRKVKNIGGVSSNRWG